MSGLITPPHGHCYQYMPVEDLISGSFGKVQKCTVHSEDGVLPGFVALKTVSWGLNSLLDKECVLYEKEAFNAIAPHDGIVRLRDSWEQGTELYLVFDYFEHGDLNEYSKAHAIDNDTLWSIHKQVLRILQHIHRQGYIFFDVKLENIVVAEVNPVKIKFIDFGAACPLNELSTRPILVTKLHAAPELLNPASRNTVSTSCDYYAWNISLFLVAVRSIWGYGGPGNAECLPHFLSGYSRRMRFDFIQPARTPREVLFHAFLQDVSIAAPDRRMQVMVTHPWVTERPTAVLVAAATAWSSAVLAAVAGSSHNPMALPAPPTSHASPTSPQSTVRLPAEPSSSTGAVTLQKPTKRAGVEKCLEKEKAGKGSGVGSTAGKRVTAARKKASKTRAASPGQAQGGPAEGVKQRRAMRPIVDYRVFL